ncbi:hypothetical protein ABTA76_19505, partial [Acinetobacter baumannii]
KKGGPWGSGPPRVLQSPFGGLAAELQVFWIFRAILWTSSEFLWRFLWIFFQVFPFGMPSYL